MTNEIGGAPYTPSQALTHLTRSYAAAAEHMASTESEFHRSLEQGVRGLVAGWDTTFPKGRASAQSVLITLWPEHSGGSTPLHGAALRTVGVVLRKLEQEGRLRSSITAGVVRYQRGAAA